MILNLAGTLKTLPPSSIVWLSAEAAAVANPVSRNSCIADHPDRGHPIAVDSNLCRVFDCKPDSSSAIAAVQTHSGQAVDFSDTSNSGRHSKIFHWRGSPLCC
jgi:hypothetical protein